MQRPHALRLLVLAALTLLPGCLIRSDSNVEHRGQYVGPQTLAQIEPGRGKDFVLALLGQPTHRSQLADGSELWRWSYSQVTRSKAGLIFVLSSKRSSEEHGVVFVEFQDDQVVRCWRD